MNMKINVHTSIKSYSLVFLSFTSYTQAFSVFGGKGMSFVGLCTKFDYFDDNLNSFKFTDFSIFCFFLKTKNAIVATTTAILAIIMITRTTDTDAAIAPEFLPIMKIIYHAMIML